MARRIQRTGFFRVKHRPLIPGLLLSLICATQAIAAPRVLPHPDPNPDLETACGLNVLMILDESTSINMAGASEDVRNAFKAFTAAIKNTSSSMAVAEFSTVARLPTIGPAPPGTYITVTDTTQALLDAYVDTGYDPPPLRPSSGIGYTNWEDGVRMGISNHAPRTDFQVPHLVVFITDGEPTRSIKSSVSDTDYHNKVPLSASQVGRASADSGAAAAIANANHIKAQGSHILAIAVGNGISSSQAIDRLEKISGPDIYDGAGGFDISTDDIYRVPDFAHLQAALREAAFQLCAPSVTIEKLVDLTPDPGTTGDAVPSPNWTIEGAVNASGGYDWILPVQESPGSGPKSVVTDAVGFASYQWLPNQAGPSDFTATEVLQVGYSNDQSQTSCNFRTPDAPDQPLGISVGDGTFSASVPEESIVTCKFINIADPSPGISLEKSTDGLDADTAPGAPIRKGEVVTWAYRVTNTGNTTLNNITVTDQQTGPITAAGPVVNCNGKTTLAVGESMTCTSQGISGQTAGGVDFTTNSIQYSNLARVQAVDTHNNPVTDTDPSHYQSLFSEIAIEKYTNDQDADFAPGPLVTPGMTVTWRYEVRNAGSENLLNVVVSDDKIGALSAPDSGDTNGDNILNPGETWIYRAQGTAGPGQYINRANVTADPALGGPAIGSQDPSHYFGVVAGLDIEKSTNGDPADAAPGPTIAIGDDVLWHYVVTNTGNYPLDQIVVTDDQGITPNCPSGILPAGASLTCTARGTAQAGQYANLGTASAPHPLGGIPLFATDPSHYFGAQPAITLEKTTNDEDADDEPGPHIPVAGAVSWSYLVTNSGESPLSDLAVIDSDLGDITASCGQTSLPIGASTLCSGSGSAVAGQYRNLALALATGLNTLVGALDPSHYFGDDPGIKVEKLTNGEDADTPPGPLIREGDPVTWVYEITNTGNDDLQGLTLEDDQLGPIGCPQTSLIPGETIQCTADAIAVTGQHANLATVRASSQSGTVVSGTDPSHYLGVIVAIRVEKSTNGLDADSPIGAIVPIGDPVTWRYQVSNPGDTALRHISLTDNQGVTPIFQGGDSHNDGLLEPGETWLYEAQGIAVAGLYSNIAQVAAIDVLENPAEDSDPSHYFGLLLQPDIELEKSTNGLDADVPPGPLLKEGNLAHFNYVVTNSGNTFLTDVRISDDQGLTIACPSGNPIAVMGPGTSETCSASARVSRGQYANVGTVMANAPDGSIPSDTDPSHHLGTDAAGVRADIELEKATNGLDADTPPGPILPVDSTAHFRYSVTNTGNIYLSEVRVSDDHGIQVDCPGGNPIPLLRVGTTITCTATVRVSAGSYSNIGSATGTVPDASEISDSDPSHHFGGTGPLEIPATPKAALSLLVVLLGGIGALVGFRSRPSG